MPQLYRLTRGDKELFKQAKERNEPNIITDYYLRNPHSGTWWLPGSTSEKWRSGYERLFLIWKQNGKPDSFTVAGVQYVTRFDHERQVQFPDQPAFFHNHGMLFLPYHKELHNDRHSIRTIIGGFGAGKTLGIAMSAMVHGLLLPQFRYLALAPLSIQALEVYELIMNMISDTEFERRFMIASPTKPFPKIIFGHEDVGICKIECYPIAGRETKLRTLTADAAMVDQAEHEAIDIPEIRRSIGTRFRGRVAKNGRERLGTLTFVANAGDKQELWDLFDEAETDPENFLSMAPTSYDNIWLTDKDIQRFELQVGSSKEAKDIYLMGKRPLGNGVHFSKAVLEAMRDGRLDDEMEQGIRRQEVNDADYGYTKMEGKNVGCFEWLLPYKEGHQYLVMSDPGTENPPARNSPVIMVWDITHFPGDLNDPKPATLAGFVWVYAHRKITTWAQRFAEIVKRYHAIGQCGFDATGYQSGYDQWMNVLNNIYAERVNLAGNNKALCLNAAKVLSSREMLKAPKAISHLYQQLARYEYPPEPAGIRQDIVITLMMSAWWMQRLFYNNNEAFESRKNFDEYNRYTQPLEDRYGGHER